MQVGSIYSDPLATVHSGWFRPCTSGDRPTPLRVCIGSIMLASKAHYMPRNVSLYSYEHLGWSPKEHLDGACQIRFARTIVTTPSRSTHPHPQPPGDTCSPLPPSRFAWPTSGGAGCAAHHALQFANGRSPNQTGTAGAHPAYRQGGHRVVARCASLRLFCHRAFQNWSKNRTDQKHLDTARENLLPTQSIPIVYLSPLPHTPANLLTASETVCSGDGRCRLASSGLAAVAQLTNGSNGTTATMGTQSHAT